LFSDLRQGWWGNHREATTILHPLATRWQG
jgi:hypothetical protein